MGLPARRPSLEVAEHRFGRSARWARDAALVGGWTGWAGAVFMWLSLIEPGLLQSLALLASSPMSGIGLLVSPIFVAAGIAGAVVGGLLGVSGPTLLNELRGRVPIPMLALGLPVASAGLATAVAVLAAWAVGIPAMPAVACGIATTAVQVAVFWLPYTVASVVGTPRWPVLGVASLVGPFTGVLAALFLTLL